MSIKIPYAIKNGKLIHISEVESGLHLNCLCVGCKKPLIANKGEKKADHFSHHKKSNCQPESVLHLLGKEFLKSRIDSAIEQGIPLHISWLCDLCGDTHSGNLIKKVVSSELEHPIGDSRADLALLGGSGEIIAVAEIIVTHPPEETTIQNYKDRGVVRLDMKLKDESDLLRINSDEILHFDHVDLCTRPKCKKCKSPFSECLMHIVTTECWACNSNMKVSFIESEGDLYEVADFLPREIKFAKERGALIARRYDGGARKMLCLNVCPKCQTMAGWLSHTNLINMVQRSVPVSLPMMCKMCRGLVDPF